MNHNKRIISGLEQQEPIELKLEEVNKFDNIKYKGVLPNKRKGGGWDAHIVVEGLKCYMGAYDSELEAAVGYATASHHLVKVPKRRKIHDAVLAADRAYNAFVSAGPASVPMDDKSREKYDNSAFFEDNREHHVPGCIPELNPDHLYYSDDACHKMHKEMDEMIEQCADLRVKFHTEKYANKLKSLPCRAVFRDINAPIYEMFEHCANSVEELDDMVKRIMCAEGYEDLDLYFFYEREKIKSRESYGKNDTLYKGYVAKTIQHAVRKRMVTFLSKRCHYCGDCMDRYRINCAGKFYGWHNEHLSILGAKANRTSDNTSGESHALELVKTVPCCSGCNPCGDESRGLPVDRFQYLSIVVEDKDLPEHQTPRNIVNSEKFKAFYKKACDMGLEYCGKVDVSGRPLAAGAQRTKRCADFLEFKLLIWELFQILLEDIVMFRRISDHSSPQYCFRTTVINLIKALCNSCPGTKKGGRCRGKYNLRNLRPWEYVGCDYDHNSGDGIESKHPRLQEKGKSISALMGYDWEVFIEEICKCVVLCADCHMGD